MTYRTLVICRANHARSKGLCALLRHYARDDHELEFYSAGIDREIIDKKRREGDTTRPIVIEVWNEFGIPIEEKSILHVSEVGTDFDLVLTVSENVEQFLDSETQFKGNVRNAMEYAGLGRGDIWDADETNKKDGITKTDPKYKEAHIAMFHTIDDVAQRIYTRLSREILKQSQSGPH